jgi:hypothetical protein
VRDTVVANTLIYTRNNNIYTSHYRRENMIRIFRTSKPVNIVEINSEENYPEKYTTTMEDGRYY